MDSGIRTVGSDLEFTPCSVRYADGFCCRHFVCRLYLLGGGEFLAIRSAMYKGC